MHLTNIHLHMVCQLCKSLSSVVAEFNTKLDCTLLLVIDVVYLSPHKQLVTLHAAATNNDAQYPSAVHLTISANGNHTALTVT